MKTKNCPCGIEPEMFWSDCWGSKCFVIQCPPCLKQPQVATAKQRHIISIAPKCCKVAQGSTRKEAQENWNRAITIDEALDELPEQDKANFLNLLANIEEMGFILTQHERRNRNERD